jgi:hypothetical protein
MHDSHDNEIAFSFRSSFKWSKDSTVTSESVLQVMHINDPRPTSQATLFPDLTNFRHISPCRWKATEFHGLQRELPTAGFITEDSSTTVVDSQVVKCNRFSYQQVIHILPHCKHVKCSTSLGQGTVKNGSHKSLGQNLFQVSFDLIDRCIHNSVQDQPVFPPAWGLLDKERQLPFSAANLKCH